MAAAAPPQEMCLPLLSCFQGSRFAAAAAAPPVPVPALTNCCCHQHPAASGGGGAAAASTAAVLSLRSRCHIPAVSSASSWAAAAAAGLAPETVCHQQQRQAQQPEGRVAASALLAVCVGPLDAAAPVAAAGGGCQV